MPVTFYVGQYHITVAMPIIVEILATKSPNTVTKTHAASQRITANCKRRVYLAVLVYVAQSNTETSIGVGTHLAASESSVPITKAHAVPRRWHRWGDPFDVREDCVEFAVSVDIGQRHGFAVFCL